jgi:hypothetical protein
MALEPFARKLRHFIKRSRLFEQVAGPGDDHELLFAAQVRKNHAVQPDHVDVVSPDSRVIEESLLIFGWVANWRPIEIFLYEWWPIVRRRNLYRRLSAARVELRPYKSDRPANSV